MASDGSMRRNVATQTRTVLKTIKATLETYGASLQDCANMVVFLVDMADFETYNAAYSEFFAHTGPTRTTVAVRALPHPDMVIEMKAVAFKPWQKATVHDDRLQ